MLNKKDEKVIIDELIDVESRRMTEDVYMQTRQNPQKQTPDKFTNYPDAKKHQIVSFIKSGIRIFGYILLPINILAGASVLVVSEVVGIIEELV